MTRYRTKSPLPVAAILAALMMAFAVGPAQADNHSPAHLAHKQKQTKPLSPEEEAQRQADAKLLADAATVFAPLPADMATADTPISPERVQLGRMLFFDRRLSVDGTTSCMRCHEPALYGTDGMEKPHGNHDKPNARNAPTVLNAAAQFVAHWAGDRKSVEDQATRALTGPASMGNPDFDAAMARIKAIPGYAELFRRAFPNAADPVTPDNFGKVVGAFERTLVTPSRFDAFLKGQASALSSQEKAGLRKFMDLGCASCHSGVGVGGGSFQKFGVTANYWPVTGSQEIDQGRYLVTHDDADLYVFKVPSLRNVAMTPPYFHDGSVPSLDRAVVIMAKLQLGADLGPDDTRDIVAFLGSLTGEMPKDFITAPILPPSAFKDGK